VDYSKWVEIHLLEETIEHILEIAKILKKKNLR